jgi:hypothetical protein
MALNIQVLVIGECPNEEPAVRFVREVATRLMHRPR